MKKLTKMTEEDAKAVLELAKQLSSSAEIAREFQEMYDDVSIPNEEGIIDWNGTIAYILGNLHTGVAYGIWPGEG